MTLALSSSAQEAYQSLSFLATLVEPSASNRADFLEECRSGALNGVKVIYRTFASVGVTGRIDGEVVAALGKEGLQVGFVCNNGVFDVQTRGSCIFSCGPLWGLLFVREKKGDGYCAAAEGGFAPISPALLFIIECLFVSFHANSFYFCLCPCFVHSNSCRSNPQALATTISTSQPAPPPEFTSRMYPQPRTPLQPTPLYFSSLVLCVRSTPPYAPCVKAHGTATHRRRLAMTLRINCWGSLVWGG